MGYMNVLSLFFIQTVLLVVLVAETKAKVPAIIVFGDSSVDTGNNNVISTLLKSNFKPYGRDFEGGLPTGRFCNGRVPPDFISEAFGLKPAIPAYLDPQYSISDFATGVCFASAGTGYDNATSDVLVSLRPPGISHLNHARFCSVRIVLANIVGIIYTILYVKTYPWLVYACRM